MLIVRAFQADSRVKKKIKEAHSISRLRVLNSEGVRASVPHKVPPPMHKANSMSMCGKASHEKPVVGVLRRCVPSHRNHCEVLETRVWARHSSRHVFQKSRLVSGSKFQSLGSVRLAFGKQVWRLELKVLNFVADVHFGFRANYQCRKQITTT